MNEKMKDPEAARYTESTVGGIKKLEPKIDKVMEPEGKCTELAEYEKQNAESDQPITGKMTGPSSPNILDKK